MYIEISGSGICYIYSLDHREAILWIKYTESRSNWA